MRLLKEFIQKQLDLINYFELNQFYIQEVGHFYITYLISLNVIGAVDLEIRAKNKLFKRFLESRNNESVFFSLYGKLKDCMKEDINVINLAMDSLNKQKEENAYMGDYYSLGIIGVSIHDFN